MTDKLKLPMGAQGKRPTVFDDPNVDHLVTMSLEMATELYTVYSRLDTLERVLENAGLLERAALETYRPNETVNLERAEWRELFLDRLFRTIKADQG